MTIVYACYGPVVAQIVTVVQPHLGCMARVTHISLVVFGVQRLVDCKGMGFTAICSVCHGLLRLKQKQLH